MRYILNDLIEELEKNLPCVIATVVGSSGSAPRTSGARMLVREGGSLEGSVGGGAVEGRCLALARELLHGKEDQCLLEFDLSVNDASALGMVCGGALSILLQKGKTTDLELFKRLRVEYREGRQPTLLTHLPSPDGDARFSLLEDEEDVLRNKIFFNLQQQRKRIPLLFKNAENKYFIETLVPPGTVYLIGAGHVALATAKIAHFSNFEVVVMDDREEFANRERYPQAKQIKVLGSFENCFDKLRSDDYVVIVTRGHIHDKEVLAQALATEAGYIGMIGSRKKIQAIYNSLLEAGFTQNELDAVHSPIGLDIGADTPEELAISIVAELIQVRANR